MSVAITLEAAMPPLVVVRRVAGESAMEAGVVSIPADALLTRSSISGPRSTPVPLVKIPSAVNRIRERLTEPVGTEAKAFHEMGCGDLGSKNSINRFPPAPDLASERRSWRFEVGHRKLPGTSRVAGPADIPEKYQANFSGET